MMYKIELLDNKLKQLNSYDLTMIKYAKNTLVVTMMIMMFFLMILYEDGGLLYLSMVLLISSLTSLNISQYLYVKKDNIKIPIYISLKETGICKKAFIKSRLKYHFVFMYKLCIGSIITCLLGGDLYKGLNMKDICSCMCFIFLYIIIGTISFFLDLYQATKE